MHAARAGSGSVRQSKRAAAWVKWFVLTARSGLWEHYGTFLFDGDFFGLKPSCGNHSPRLAFCLLSLAVLVVDSSREESSAICLSIPDITCRTSG